MENIGIGVLDVLFISVFLVCNVILGFISRNKCDDINETVFGKKSKFSNLTLITSICSTMVSSIFVINTIEQINLKGLQMLIMYLVMFPGMYCIMYFVMLPKIIKTEMRFSWFDYINKNYGKIVRVVFALCSLTLDIGWIAQLFVTMNITMQAIFNGSPYFCKILSIVIGIILTIYSAFGGLRAVTITDVFQFFVFFTIIVFISLFFWVKSPEYVHETFFSLFDGNNEKLTWNSCFGSFSLTIATLSFWLLQLIPDPQQALYQRWYASRSLKEAKKNMFYGFIIFFIFASVVVFIALQIMASDGNLKQSEIIPYLINKFEFPGLKGLFCIAILSMAVSTTDSVLNSSAVILGNDVICPILKCNISSSIIRKLTLFIGIVAMTISYFATSIFDIFVNIGEFVFPIMCFSFLAIVIGLKTHKYVIYLSMLTGFLPVLVYHLLGYDNYGFAFGAIGNLLGLILGHIFLVKYLKIKISFDDNFKRLKDFEYDDDIERERLRKEEIERQKEIELREEFKKTLNNRMKDIVEEYRYCDNKDEIEKIREHVKKSKEESEKENKNK